ncbi:MAG TPA: CpaD family pilus assembly lipoprotein [Sphingomicrobium sp.]|nr:CpaD family pilus assembly lipoprotein [Sphingomicrobium sp.]
MRTRIAIVLLASAAVAGCNTPTVDDPARGLNAVNQPVVSRTDLAMDLAAPDGSVSATEQARLDGWFAGLGLGYGDHVYVDGDYARGAGADVARVAGRYGMMVSAGSPVTSGPVQPGTVRVVVTRTRASVPGCPNWDRPASPDFENRQMPNFGCGVSSNIAAMAADPQDLLYGREAGPVIDAASASKAVNSYRAQKPTGENGLQAINTKGGN